MIRCEICGETGSTVRERPDPVFGNTIMCFDCHSSIMDVRKSWVHNVEELAPDGVLEFEDLERTPEHDQ